MNRLRLTAAAIETLEDRKLLHAPTLDAIANYTMPAGNFLYVPLTASYDHADPLRYTASDTSLDLQVGVRSVASTWIQMDVDGYSEPMVFQLFDDLAPKTVATMKGLIQAGYFDGQTFHRVINNFVLQGGDPKSLQPYSSTNVWGTGGPGFQFDDEFNPAAVFSGDGQLAMANSGKDTNGSQFFITEGAQRGLDYNHTVWGQMVRGFATRNAISGVDVNSDSRPLTDVRINSVRVIANTKDAVLAIRAGAVTSGSVTVTATGAEGSASRTFNVNATADATNDPPVLTLPQSTYYTPVNTPITIPLSGFDLEGNTIDFQGEWQTSGGATATWADDAHTALVVTPAAGFTGPIRLYLGAGTGEDIRGTTQGRDGVPLRGVYDTQLITIAVGESPVSARGTKLVYTSGAPTNNVVVAQFYDADRRGTASQFTAKINWGDGSITDGVVDKLADGSFQVRGNHQYDATAADGTYPVTVDITGNLGAFVQATGSATVQQFASVRNGLLRVNGSSAADVIGVGRRGNDYHVTVNRVTRIFSAASVSSIQVYGYDDSDVIQFSPTGVIGAYIEGGNGNDSIYGGAGDDVINAGPGNDTVFTGNGTNRVAGGDGNDSITGGDGRDRLFGGAGNDVINGGAGRDIISGDEGNDILVGNASNDTIYGGEGDDILNGLSGADYIDGGPGRDTTKYDELDTRIAVEVLV